MTDAVNVRELALETLMEIFEGGSYSHLALRAVLEKYQYLGKKERAFLTRLVEGTIQRMLELDYILDRFSKVKTKKMKPLIRTLLRMSVYQLRYMDAVPDAAVCNEAVKLAKRHGFGTLSGYVNGVLRGISRNPGAVTYPDERKDPVGALSVRYSAPRWLVEQWSGMYGEACTGNMLAAFLRDAPLTIRTNLAKVTPQELRERLAAEGVVAEELAAEGYPKLPYAFTVSGIDHLNGLAAFREGLFYVQDVSSMLVAEYAAPGEGDYCIDVCGAPGGKGLHLAEKLRGSGHVEIRDLTERKVALIEENIRRSGLANLSARRWDATVFDEASAGRADIVIADLPCSGLGVLRKKTDIKYRMSVEQERELAALQRRILHTVAAYVKPGGTLLYSTCTIDRMENEENVAWFLGEHPGFRLEKQQQIFPQEALGDGFFLAKLVRSRE